MKGFRIASVFVSVVAALAIAGCTVTQPGLPHHGGQGDSPPPVVSITPAQQCQLVTTLAAASETGVLIADIKSAKTRDGVEFALAAVKAGAADYCAAVSSGNAPDALELFLTAFNASLADLNAKLRAAKAAKAVAYIERRTERATESARASRPLTVASLMPPPDL